ncbi:hypothetical protein WJX74_009002 [Apatococcus lobatus]|uniref:Uncharacterized protein n=1 Tax=Apatococcus lobatus TaxID=904363 RepID=A0AAW1QKK5_9CHLO
MSLEERSGSTCSRYSAGTRLSLQNLAKVQHGEHRLQKLPNEVLIHPMMSVPRACQSLSAWIIWLSRLLIQLLT